MTFPIDLSQYEPLVLNYSQTSLKSDQRERLVANINLARDSIVFFTALANLKGLGGHTGGAYDIVPELLITDGFMKGSDQIYPVFFDEAGHRVAIQYLMAVLNNYQTPEVLLKYREVNAGLYGHPERNDQKGIFFSSGRLGHLWSYVNGVASAYPDKTIVMFGSDGSQQEGGDAEAARYAVAHKLNVKLFIDDNDVTIAGHPSQYMSGFDVGQTLQGHSLTVDSGDGEDIDSLYVRIQKAITSPGPVALVNKRPMAVGIAGIEGSPKAHDVIAVDLAIDYLETRGQTAAVEMLKTSTPKAKQKIYQGSTPEKSKCRDKFGQIVCRIIGEMPDYKSKLLVIDSDLEGSCGLHHIRKKYPEIYVNGGIMERNNFSAAAGFGSSQGRQGIFGTFAAFLEMVVSEISMARLNQANVLAHFSHSGVDDMADNTCHFGINNFFADSGLAENDQTHLYFPADANQMQAIVETIFNDPGLRFIFSTRSATPLILDEAGQPFYGNHYRFMTGRDEIIREGIDGYVLSYGEMLYRCLDVIEQLRAEGIQVGLINKPTLNVVDNEMLAKLGASKFVLVVETQNTKTGLGIRYGTWLLEKGYTPVYAHMGSHKEGRGGLGEQIPNQGIGREKIHAKIIELREQTQ